MTAAISAARRGRSVVVCDRMPELGKKISVSGNGRCNLSNRNLDESFYNFASQPLVKSVFARFGEEHIIDFFRTIGVYTDADDGRVFPVTGQASTVLKSLLLELKRLSVPAELNFEAVDITGSRGRFTVSSKSGKTVESETAILAGGGRAYPALGSDGSVYRLAESMGHEIIPPVPAAVPILVRDELCHRLQGQRITARIRAIVKDRAVSEAYGDLLFTKYGLSGTCVLDASDEISVAINRKKVHDVSVVVDLVPFLSKEELSAEIALRIDKGAGAEDFLAGILPNKFGRALWQRLGMPREGKAADMLKEMVFKVAGTRGWNECEFTAGGVDTAEVCESTMQSRLKPGLYLAGEILDVNGRRGGYNLAWAWASGYMAGLGD